MKPINPPNDGSAYAVDVISDTQAPPPNMVQTHLRNLLVACELGDLVLLECIRSIDGKLAHVICASVVDLDNKRKLLPICELEDTADILARFRPPSVVENDFVKPSHSGMYEVTKVEDPDELALVEVRKQ